MAASTTARSGATTAAAASGFAWSTVCSSARQWALQSALGGGASSCHDIAASAGLESMQAYIATAACVNATAAIARIAANRRGVRNGLMDCLG